MTVRRIAESRLFTILMLAVIGVGGISLMPGQPASAQAQPVVIRITVERVTALSDVEGPGCGQADFYGRVTIDGDTLPDSNTVEDDDDIFPDWEFSKIVDSSSGSVTARLEIWEDDWFGLCLGDDQMDIAPDTTDKGLDIVIDFNPCMIGADLPAGSFDPTCGTAIHTEGTGGEATAVDFRVEVDEPPSAENMRVKCVHDPVWPQPGEDVDITASALDAQGDVFFADQIEVWVDGAVDRSETNRTALTDTITAPNGDFSYGCRIELDGIAIWSGWHRVTVGDSSDPEAIPVLLTGPRSSRIDIVFVADVDDFVTNDNANFLRSIRGSINNFYGLDVFLKNQDMFNFWIAQGTGNAETAGDGCDHTAPEIPWAETRVVLHAATGEFRDCAPRGEHIVSTDVKDLRTVVHETLHSSFGLADEYPGDGGYFQADPYPNLYHELGPYQFFYKVYTGCEQDAVELGRTPEDCREINDENNNWFDYDWYLSDPTPDIMSTKTSSALAPAQAADIRRVEWVFSHCRASDC